MRTTSPGALKFVEATAEAAAAAAACVRSGDEKDSFKREDEVVEKEDDEEKSMRGAPKSSDVRASVSAERRMIDIKISRVIG